METSNRYVCADFLIDRMNLKKQSVHGNRFKLALFFGSKCRVYGNAIYVAAYLKIVEILLSYKCEFSFA